MVSLYQNTHCLILIVWIFQIRWPRKTTPNHSISCGDAKWSINQRRCRWGSIKRERKGNFPQTETNTFKAIQLHFNALTGGSPCHFHRQSTLHHSLSLSAPLTFPITPFLNVVTSTLPQVLVGLFCLPICITPSCHVHARRLPCPSIK